MLPSLRPAVAVLLVGVVALLVRDPAPEVLGRWDAEAPFYDFLEAVTFRDNGSGELIYGDHQVVRTKIAFTWTLVPGGVRMVYGGGTSSPPRILRAASFRGNYLVPDPGPSPGEIHYRCRLRFADDPFPEDAYHFPRFDYYGCRD